MAAGGEPIDAAGTRAGRRRLLAFALLLLVAGGVAVGVVLGTGSPTPAYRALTVKDSPGQDIRQLNRDLARMGFADGEITIDGAWQTGTTDAVKRWQASLDERQTGKLALGRIVFLPGAQRVTEVDASCGSTGGGSGSGSSSGGSGPTNGCGVAEASATAPAPHPEFVEATTTTTTTISTTTTPTTTAAPTTSTTATRSTTATTPTPARTSSASGDKSSRSRPSGGSGGGSSTTPASVILQTTSPRLVVTVDLDPSKQFEAKVGERVSVEMPAGNRVKGTISSVSSVAQSSSASGSGSSAGAGNGSGGGGSSGPTIPVMVTLSGRQAGAGLDHAAVSVNFAQARARNALSVPVTALLATAGGGYAVQTATAPHKLIAVTTGLFAAGYVEISGAGIHPGLRVTDSQG